MKAHPHLITSAPEIKQLAQILAHKKVIAFDTEFIRENTFYPIVEIIQIATESESWIIDAQAFRKGFKPGPKGGFDEGIQPLLDIFTDQKILKVLHAAQGDQECLYTSFGVLASPVIDTAVAASLCGHGDGIGLGKLVKLMMDQELKKGHARTNWSVRPLPAQLIEYAHADVEFLVVMAERLLKDLENLGRKDWALQVSAKSADVANYELDPTDLARRLARGGRLDRKGHGPLLELIRWREDRVKQLNIPRRWVADDSVLMDLAQVRPKDIAHLGTFRGLNKGEIKNQGEKILSAIERGLKSEVQLFPNLAHGRGPKQIMPSAEESQLLDLMKCYVGILADEHRVAVKHLASVPVLTTLVRSHFHSVEDLRKLEILNPEACDLIGQELVDFMHGRKALTVVDGRIFVVSHEETPTVKKLAQPSAKKSPVKKPGAAKPK